MYYLIFNNFFVILEQFQNRNIVENKLEQKEIFNIMKKYEPAYDNNDYSVYGQSGLGLIIAVMFCILNCVKYNKKKYITTCIFKLKSLPAALYNSLGGFATHNVNLTKLESFTVNNTFDQALFYLDIEGHINDPKINAAMEVLKKNTESLDILGVYQASNYRNKD